MKRLFDIVVSALLLVLVSPLFLVVALLVRFTSAGPVFFKQSRMGRDFVPFEILKFRTMVANAPALGGQLTAGADPRITRVGHFLRKSKIDELPQLWNVLSGEMSLVGPRPEVPKYVEMFRDDYREILSVRPGITDPASIKYRDESSILAQASNPEKAYIEQILPEKIALSKTYIQHSSLAYDLQLILQSVLRILH